MFPPCMFFDIGLFQRSLHLTGLSFFFYFFYSPLFPTFYFLKFLFGFFFHTTDWIFATPLLTNPSPLPSIHETGHLYLFNFLLLYYTSQAPHTAFKVRPTNHLCFLIPWTFVCCVFFFPTACVPPSAPYNSGWGVFGVNSAVIISYIFDSGFSLLTKNYPSFPSSPFWSVFFFSPLVVDSWSLFSPAGAFRSIFPFFIHASPYLTCSSSYIAHRLVSLQTAALGPD